MAVTAMEKYTVTYIQAIWRGYLARQRFHLLQAKHFLRTYLSFRYRWKRQSKASRIIIGIYRRFSILSHLKSVAIPSQKARIIQKAYKRRFLQKRGIIRFRTHQVWEHMKLFGICRAKNILSPLEREKRVIYNLFLRFHRRLRARR